jgi:hypothetical protein
MPSHKRIPSWAHDLIRDAKIYGAPENYLRESKKPKPYSICVACFCDIMDEKPYSYKEATKNSVWKHAMGGEYHSILNNDVWDAMPSPKEKSVVS